MSTAEILLQIQNELQCGKDKYNTFGGFAYRNAESSPYTRGCFSLFLICYDGNKIFPVHTGVFLLDIYSRVSVLDLPRTHGGVSCS